jgi:hypothetical protein
MSISTILNGATVAQDADSAAIFADILNNDLRAIMKLKGGSKFEAEDALRISRIWAEYQGMESGKTSYRPTSQRTMRPASSDAAATV